jgi:hypothetical protein
MHGIERARRAYLSLPILLIGVAFACAECVIGREEGDEFDRASTKMRYATAPNTDTLLFQRTYPYPTQADTTSRICSRRALHPPRRAGHTCLFTAHGWHGAPNHMEPSSAAPFPGVAGGCTPHGGTGKNNSCNVMDLVVHAPYSLEKECRYGEGWRQDSWLAAAHRHPSSERVNHASDGSSERYASSTPALHRPSTLRREHEFASSDIQQQAPSLLQAHAARCTHHFSTLLMRASLSLPEHAIVARYYVDRILLPGLTERRLLDVSAMSISVAHRSIHTVHTSRSHVSCSVKVMPRG